MERNAGMNLVDLLRFYSLGIINVLGIILPGLIYLLCAALTVVMPLGVFLADLNRCLYARDLAEIWDAAAGFASANGILLGILAILLAYVVGYLLRLWTVDRLDSISADHVFRQFSALHARGEALPGKPSRRRAAQESRLAAAQKENWPYWGEIFDTFPYLHLRQYLARRGLSHLAELVTWEDQPYPAKGIQRSKKIIDNYKIEVSSKSPLLASIVESNEAHIRMLHGIWQSARVFTWCGASAAFGCLVLLLNEAVGIVEFSIAEPRYAALFFLETMVVVAAIITTRRIEKLFHYQRVKELVQLLACTHFARQPGAAAGSMQPGRRGKKIASAG
jgi:hypothetical protein